LATGLNFLGEVDWARPWLAPYSSLSLGSSSDSMRSVAALLNASPHAPLTFVDQSALPPGTAYEQFIFETATVPTRDNLHDFFNGLCWLRFPQTKKKLNQLQATEIARAGVRPLRGAARDALTVFDENAALLIAPQPLWDALTERDWQKLFVHLRPLWQQAQLILFGHALLEKLVNPRKPITAHVYRAQPAIDSIAQIDAWLAGDVSAAKLSAKPFLPLPVLGVPGWWAANENPSFYRDTLVFRPPK
jgi:hypothetical protein